MLHNLIIYGCTICQLVRSIFPIDGNCVATIVECAVGVRSALERTFFGGRTMKKTINVICFIIIAILCSCLFVSCGDKDLSIEQKQKLIANASVGDYVQLGKYEQDNDITNGKENIEWLVLSKGNNKVLLISRYCLDCKAHYANDTANGQELFRWDNSLIATWLNSLFINNAFSSEEKNLIVSTLISDVDCVSNPTYNKVFLLSNSEIQKYFLSANERKATATAFAKSQGADGNWWSRSKPTNGTDTALRLRFVYVNSNGKIDSDGNSCLGGYTSLGIRPAIWVSM